MSPSSTIANICGACQRRPRWYRFFVIRWKIRLPLPVNARRTIGCPVVGSKSAWVPDDFSSAPVISGIRFSSSGFVGSCLNR